MISNQIELLGIVYGTVIKISEHILLLSNDKDILYQGYRCYSDSKMNSLIVTDELHEGIKIDGRLEVSRYSSSNKEYSVIFISNGKNSFILIEEDTGKLIIHKEFENKPIRLGNKIIIKYRYQTRLIIYNLDTRKIIENTTCVNVRLIQRGSQKVFEYEKRDKNDSKTRLMMVTSYGCEPEFVNSKW